MKIRIFDLVVKIVAEAVSVFCSTFTYFPKIPLQNKTENNITHQEVMGQPNSDSKRKISDPKDSTSFFSILIASFSTIFLAELGDKTQIATLMLSAQSGKPLIIFIGAALALISTSLLGVLIGRWIANNLPRQSFTLVTGIIMLSLGIYLVAQGFIDFFRIQN